MVNFFEWNFSVSTTSNLDLLHSFSSNDVELRIVKRQNYFQLNWISFYLRIHE